VKYPTERRSLWGGEEVTVCPELCSKEAGCRGQHGKREHWWGQHNSTCASCKEVYNWRRDAGIENHPTASGLGPDHKGVAMVYPVSTTDADIAEVVNSLRKLEADLA
jgi:hypothetical protein